MWYTLFAEWAYRGLPILRPLWWDAMDDTKAFDHVNTHMLVGEGVLVRAVTDAGARSVETYLPAGDWVDYWNLKAAPLAGGKVHSLSLEKGRIPVFVKLGQILFKRMRRRRSTGAQMLDPYSIFVYGDKAAGKLYVDDGTTHDYKEGKFIYEQFSFDGVTLTERPATDFLSIGEAKGVSSLPERSLAVERVVFLRLSAKPTGASLKRGGASDSLSVTSEQAADGRWIATVKKPTGLLGGQWSLELTF